MSVAEESPLLLLTEKVLVPESESVMSSVESQTGLELALETAVLQMVSELELAGVE